MPLTTPIKRFNTITSAERFSVVDSLAHPLSGYLAGTPRGGFWVQSLEEEWAGRMNVRHAIACNSATSGLLAAAAVCGPEHPHLDIAVPCFTMSATAAASKLLYPNDLYFMDCDTETYCSTPAHCPKSHIGMIVVTDLFGQAAPLTQWRELADRLGIMLVEDAAQSPFALTPDGKLAGTIGDVGVFSLNVHKHMQAGEGGMIVTNSDELANELRAFINHGETMDYPPGLNLRMTELTAAIASVQLSKADEIISSRRSLAHELSDMVKDFWAPPVEEGFHVYYHWAVRTPWRNAVYNYLTSERVPVRKGYVDPLYRLPAFKDWASPCLVAEDAHDNNLLIFEVCAWDPTTEQLKEMRDIFRRAEEYSNLS